VPFAVAAGISAGAGLLGGVMQSSAISGAADKAAAATREAAAQQRADLAPWATTGGLANTASTDLLGLNGPDAAAAAMANYQTSPGYQWQLSEGLRATDAGAAARGFTRSGAALKAEQTFGQGLANSDFGQYYNRLFDLSKLGESAAAGQGAGALQAGHDTAAIDVAAGGAQSSIYGNIAKGIGTAANQLFSPGSPWGPTSGGTPTGFSNWNVD
jgi:hypothetical protein